MSRIFMSRFFLTCIFMSRIFMPRIVVPHFHVSYFHGTHCGAAFSCLAFSRLAFLMVPKFHFSHFQSPPPLEDPVSNSISVIRQVRSFSSSATPPTNCISTSVFMNITVFTDLLFSGIFSFTHVGDLTSCSFKRSRMP